MRRVLFVIIVIWFDIAKPPSCSMCISSKNATLWRVNLGRRSGSNSGGIPREHSDCNCCFVIFSCMTINNFVCLNLPSAQPSDAPPCTCFFTRPIFGFMRLNADITALLPTDCLPSSMWCWFRKWLSVRNRGYSPSNLSEELLPCFRGLFLWED